LDVRAGGTGNGGILFEGRKTTIGKFMGCSILGGIQPGVIGSLVDDGSKHDGLIQRFSPVFAKYVGKDFDRDIDPEQTIDRYNELIHNLYYRMPLAHGHDLHFHERAHLAKENAFDWVNAQLTCAEQDNPQLAWHLGKWENLFVRYCLLFHVIENWDDQHAQAVSVKTVQRVDRLMRDYLVPHAAAFYKALGSDDEIDQIKRACKTILINGKDTITARDLQRSLGRNKKVERNDMERVGSKLETYDWLVRIMGKRGRSDSLQWKVRPEVFKKFANYTSIFEAERDANRKAMEIAFGTHSGKPGTRKH
jgi:Protein of unknown function (DUF3987)